MADRNLHQATHEGEFLATLSSPNPVSTKHYEPDLNDQSLFPPLKSTLHAQNRPTSQPSTSSLSQPKQKEKPFLQAVENTHDSNQVITDLVFPFKPITIFQGKPSIAFNIQEKSELLAGLNFILVGKFTHGRPPMSVIQKFFANLNLQGKFNLSLMDKKHVFIECFCKADYYYIWLKLRWSIYGFIMRIFKWDSDFVTFKESSIAPVWIRLTGLPIYFFEAKTLLSIANVIGSPIKIDSKTVNRTDLGVARICVELDVAKPLIDSIWINFLDDSSKVLNGFWVQVYYDVVPAFCLECCHIGHSRLNCKRMMVDKKLATIINETPVVEVLNSGTVLDTGTVAATGDQIDPVQSGAVVEQVNDAVKDKDGQDVVEVLPVVEVLQQGTDVAEIEAEPVVEVLQQGTDAAATFTAGTEEAETVTAVVQPAEQGTDAAETEAQPVVEVLQHGTDAAATFTAGTEAETVTGVLDIKQPAAEGEAGLTPQQLQACKTPEQFQISAQQASTGLTSALPRTTSPSYQQVVSQTQSTASPITVQCSTKLNAIQSKLPQVWQKVQSKSPVKKQVETTSDIGKNVPISNRFTVIAESFPAFTEALVCSSAEKTGVQDTTEFILDVRQNSVTTRAKAKKLAQEQYNQQQFEKASVTKAKEQMQNKNLNQNVQRISQDRHESEKTTQQRIEENFKRYQYSTVKPKRTKDGCPVVVFKKEDVDKWIARQKEREQDQMRAQGLPFDDKG